MNASRKWLVVVVLAVFSGVPACSDQGPTGSGTATVSLTTPNSDDGALHVVITGPGVRDVEPASFAYKAYWRVASANELHLIVVGNLADGAVTTIKVDQLDQLDLYHVTILGVANHADELRSSLAGYAVEVTAH
jgi:hypothetical protein